MLYRLLDVIQSFASFIAKIFTIVRTIIAWYTFINLVLSFAPFTQKITQIAASLTSQSELANANNQESLYGMRLVRFKRPAVLFIVGAFLESWLFASVFLDTPEVTKIVLPKVLQNLNEGAKLYLLAQETEPQRVFFFPA